MKGAFELKILPGMPGTTGWKVRPYRQPPTKKQQAEQARQMQNAFASMTETAATGGLAHYKIQCIDPHSMYAGLGRYTK